MRASIPVEKRIAVSLRKLATGDSYTSTGLQFGISQPAANQIVHEFVVRGVYQFSTDAE